MKNTNKLYEACFNSMGVYPEKFKDQDRTEWQNGWNAFGSEFIDRVCELSEWIKNHEYEHISELIDHDDVIVFFDPIKIHYICSDIFAWGYADYEEITGEMFEEVREALKEKWGLVKYHSRRHNEKPQWPIEADMRKDGVWDLEDLPECKYDLKFRWKNKTRLEAVRGLE